MTSIEPIEFEGKQIVPLQFLKAVLPDPASLGPRTKGKTNIGCIFTGKKDGVEKTYYVYNICDHEDNDINKQQQQKSNICLQHFAQ